MRFRIVSAPLFAAAGLLTAVAASTAALAQSVTPIAMYPPTSFALDGAANSFAGAYAAGDLNEDGNMDFVVNAASPAGAALQVMYGDGVGGFRTAPFSNGPAHVDSILIADVNGDGHLDVVAMSGSYDSSYGGACCTYAGALSVYLGDGRGGFALSSSQDLPMGFANGVIGDFNGDGKPDLAVLVQSYQPQSSPSVVRLFMNHGDGSFTQGTTLGMPAMIAITAGDFNGDGKLDLAIAGDLHKTSCDAQGAVRTFYGNGDGTFGRTSNYLIDSCPTSLTSADFNHDGKTDLLVGLQARHAATARPRIATLLAKQVGFYWQSAISVPYAPYSLALADLNGDGTLDLATTWAGSTAVHTFIGTPSGRFGHHQAFSGGVATFQPLVAAPLIKNALPSLVYGSTGPFLYALINEGGAKIPLDPTR